MFTQNIDIAEAQMSIKELLSLLKEDTEIVLTNGNIPLARLLSINPSNSNSPRIPDLHPNAIIMSEDFDEPLPDEFWLGEE
ncbi:toxin-antitoxin (TA) system antitoxin [Aphanothece hegewaldii CCALA 016]|uniref:Toxin-antitoxin (TA) system antitoxin n=1 Tax=Aphanothece hegewaldii CCALA 016 TaxID=2107694 RepID=A0A2T1LTV0_9CHRO|nr:toxin-antitoxin (TA) system antitoxin [Aphanothece hegewaldii]PSF34540.1 toxin-antitoxin (TA) system antitoxin [Aphanothece hegewaldii CCALA 016]